MNELVSPYTQHLYHHFNGYNSTRPLIQNRCTACLQGLLTIICNVNTCCQIIVNKILFTVFPAFLLQENRILVLACLALLVPKIYSSAFRYQISAEGEYIDNFIEIFGHSI